MEKNKRLLVSGKLRYRQSPATNLVIDPKGHVKRKKNEKK